MEARGMSTLRLRLMTLRLLLKAAYYGLVRGELLGITRGPWPDATRQDSQPPADEKAVKYRSPLPLETLDRFKRGGRYHGIFSRVARTCRIQSCNISHVAHGRKINARVLAAIRVEMARVDAEIASKNGGAKA